MNGAQIHLALTHFPIAGIVFVLGFLLSALHRQDADVTRLALAALLVVGLSGFAAYFTGEGAEEIVEPLLEAPGGWIHRHEEAAEAGLIVLEIAAALALGGLIFARRLGGLGRGYLGLVLAAAFAAAALLARAGHFGGQVRHTEIRAATAAPPMEHDDHRAH